ncbi:MAG: hypothetical protein MUC36_24260 [Planctomycetes bacterium]|jgi:hypothetical protein|nr:hypothetical protein [Planctomycetota bacterium]
MHTIHRLLVGIALLLWLALPVVSSEGGENAGGTGVWILPRAVPLAANPTSGPPREVHVCSNLSQDLMMMVSVECGNVVATLVDEVSGISTALSVSGSAVRCPGHLLQMLVTSGVRKAHIVISDSSQTGYVIQLLMSSVDASVSMRVF